ncbi:MAG: peptidase M22 [Oscillospiraceae bacterium]|nr:peptidase M22 [Oscillospiraceae bacterium]
MISLGIDTSNYTTSAALYDGAQIRQEKQPLPVKSGARGLRQSEALFHHNAQLPELLERLLSNAPGPIEAVGVSDKPRSAEGSYMPCFLAGVSVARGIAAALRVPLRRFSHQEGHLAAALYAAGRLAWRERAYLAFHVSGGTTECLLVTPQETRLLGGTEDLNAGQAVDRVGLMLGLDFPAGPALDKLAQGGALPRFIKVNQKSFTCSFSGLENQCRQLIGQGSPPEGVALYCIEFISHCLENIARAAIGEYGALPLLFTGGVSCSEVLRRHILGQFPGAVFAPPAFSADNAAGIAVLAGASPENIDSPLEAGEAHAVHSGHLGQPTQ